MPIPPYTADELTTRASEGSVDLNRLAATVASLAITITALANWVNGQIQGQGGGSSDADSYAQTAKARKRGS